MQSEQSPYHSYLSGLQVCPSSGQAFLSLLSPVGPGLSCHGPGQVWVRPGSSSHIARIIASISTRTLCKARCKDLCATMSLRYITIFATKWVISGFGGNQFFFPINCPSNKVTCPKRARKHSKKNYNLASTKNDPLRRVQTGSPDARTMAVSSFCPNDWIGGCGGNEGEGSWVGVGEGLRVRKISYMNVVDQQSLHPSDTPDFFLRDVSTASIQWCSTLFQSFPRQHTD